MSAVKKILIIDDDNLFAGALGSALKQAGHEVKVVATQAALYFFDPSVLDSTSPQRNPQVTIIGNKELQRLLPYVGT